MAQWLASIGLHAADELRMRYLVQRHQIGD